MGVPCVFDLRGHLPQGWADGVMSVAEKVRKRGHVSVPGDAAASAVPWIQLLWTSRGVSELVSVASDTELAADTGALATDVSVEVLSGRGSRIAPRSEDADYVVLLAVTLPERAGGGRLMAAYEGVRRDATGWPGEGTLVAGGARSWDVTAKLSWTPRVMLRMGFRLVVPGTPGLP